MRCSARWGGASSTRCHRPRRARGRRGQLAIGGIRAALIVVSILAGGYLPAGAAAAVPGDPRYELAGGCYTLRPAGARSPVGKLGGGYRLSAAPGPERFRMQATDLGSYLFYDTARQFLAGASGNSVVAAPGPSAAADWQIREGPFGTSVVALPSTGKVLAFASGTGGLVLADPAAAGSSARFELDRGRDCAEYPEAELGARLVYGVRRGRVAYVAVASRSVAGSRATLKRYLSLVRLR